MLKKGSLKANVASMFSANFLYALCSWAQLSIVAKFLDGITLGYYTLTIAIITPLYMFSNMQLRSLIITDVSAKYDFYEYFKFRRIGNIFFLIVVFIIMLFGSFGKPLMLFLFTLIKIIESNADVINAFYQKEQRMHHITISLGTKSILSLIGVLIGVVLFKNIELGLLISFVFLLFFYCFYDWRKATKQEFYEKGKVNISDLKDIFFTAFPLGLVIFVISLNSNISKFFLESIVGTEEQGVYSSISYVVVLGTFVCNAVGQGFSPQLSRYFQNSQIDAFIVLFKKFLIFNIAVGILAIGVTFLFGDFILNILFNSKIAEYSSLLVIVMFLGLFIYISTALGYTLTAMREFKIQPIINLVVLFINFIILQFFINKYGLSGAVYSSIVCYIVQICLSFFFIRKKLKKL